ncbi:MAG TPA: hypothetical protein VIH86_05410 [Puia sp.]
MEERHEDQFKKHEFRINFSMQNKLYSATASMCQRTDHDEYHILPDDADLSKKYGSRILDLYFGQSKPVCQGNSNSEYTEAIVKGVEEYLNSKHS